MNILKRSRTEKGFDTLRRAMTVLGDVGHVEGFNLKQNSLVCRNGEYKMFHDEFKMDEYFRFEGGSDPGGSSIRNAIFIGEVQAERTTGQGSWHIFRMHYG